MSNPWRFNVTRTPDVTAIHQGVFDKCLDLLQGQVRRPKQCSLLVHGPAGSGKTHLIARLLRHFRQPKSTAVFSWVTLEKVSADRLWSRIRQHLVKDLLHAGAEGFNQLDRLVFSQLTLDAPPREGANGLLPQLLEFCFSQPRRKQVAQRLVEEVLPRLELGFELRTVLPRLFSSEPVEKQDARDWLQGEPLSEER